MFGVINLLLNFMQTLKSTVLRNRSFLTRIVRCFSHIDLLVHVF